MLIIGIAGGSGSGKTTVAKRIIEGLPEESISIIPQDAYYKDSSHLPPEERKNINFDHPSSIEFDLLVKHIDQLLQGNAIQMPVYSYVTCTRKEETPATSKQGAKTRRDGWQDYYHYRLDRS